MTHKVKYNPGELSGVLTLLSDGLSQMQIIDELEDAFWNRDIAFVGRHAMRDQQVRLKRYEVVVRTVYELSSYLGDDHAEVTGRLRDIHRCSSMNGQTLASVRRSYQLPEWGIEDES